MNIRKVKVVDNYSVRISEKNAYNDESRFGIINSMMFCKALGEDDAARDDDADLRTLQGSRKKII